MRKMVVIFLELFCHRKGMTYIHIVGQKDITVVVDPVKHLKHKMQCSLIRWTDSHLYEVDMYTVKLLLNFYLFTFLLKQTQL